MQTITMTRKELEGFAIESLGFRKASLRRMSTQFLAQLLQLKLRGDRSVMRMAKAVHSLENPEGIRFAARRGDGPMVRSQRWIVFKTHHGIRYYLTLASLDDGDQRINRRVQDACMFDFPFLQATA